MVWEMVLLRWCCCNGNLDITPSTSVSPTFIIQRNQGDKGLWHPSRRRDTRREHREDTGMGGYIYLSWEKAMATWLSSLFFFPSASWQAFSWSLSWHSFPSPWSYLSIFHQQRVPGFIVDSMIIFHLFSLHQTDISRLIIISLWTRFVENEPGVLYRSINFQYGRYIEHSRQGTGTSDVK